MAGNGCVSASGSDSSPVGEAVRRRNDGLSPFAPGTRWGEGADRGCCEKRPPDSGPAASARAASSAARTRWQTSSDSAGGDTRAEGLGPFAPPGTRRDSGETWLSRRDSGGTWLSSPMWPTPLAARTGMMPVPEEIAQHTRESYSSRMTLCHEITTKLVKTCAYAAWLLALRPRVRCSHATEPVDHSRRHSRHHRRPPGEAAAASSEDHRTCISGVLWGPGKNIFDKETEPGDL